MPVFSTWCTVLHVVLVYTTCGWGKPFNSKHCWETLAAEPTCVLCIISFWARCLRLLRPQVELYERRGDEQQTIQKTEATTNGTAHHALIIPNEQNEINLNFGLFRNVFICWIHQASFTPERIAPERIGKSFHPRNRSPTHTPRNCRPTIAPE